MRGRIKRIITNDAAKNVYPTSMDLATLANEPERALRAIQAQQATAQTQDEGALTSTIAKRIAAIGNALGIDTDSPAAVSNMVGLLSALGTANRQLDRKSWLEPPPRG